jgi:hypothetical protein
MHMYEMQIALTLRQMKNAIKVRPIFNVTLFSSQLVEKSVRIRTIQMFIVDPLIIVAAYMK